MLAPGPSVTTVLTALVLQVDSLDRALIGDADQKTILFHQDAVGVGDRRALDPSLRRSAAEPVHAALEGVGDEDGPVDADRKVVGEARLRDRQPLDDRALFRIDDNHAGTLHGVQAAGVHLQAGRRPESLDPFPGDDRAVESDLRDRSIAEVGNIEQPARGVEGDRLGSGELFRQLPGRLQGRIGIDRVEIADHEAPAAELLGDPEHELVVADFQGQEQGVVPADDSEVGGIAGPVAVASAVEQPAVQVEGDIVAVAEGERAGSGLRRRG